MLGMLDPEDDGIKTGGDGVNIYQPTRLNNPVSTTVRTEILQCQNSEVSEIMTSTQEMFVEYLLSWAVIT
jgi:hypothetical protein